MRLYVDRASTCSTQLTQGADALPLLSKAEQNENESDIEIDIYIYYAYYQYTYFSLYKTIYILGIASLESAFLATLNYDDKERKGNVESKTRQGSMDQQTLTQMAALVTAGVLGHFLNCMFVKLCRMRYISELVHVINHVLLKKIVH